MTHFVLPVRSATKNLSSPPIPFTLIRTSRVQGDWLYRHRNGGKALSQGIWKSSNKPQYHSSSSVQPSCTTPISKSQLVKSNSKVGGFLTNKKFSHSHIPQQLSKPPFQSSPNLSLNDIGYFSPSRPPKPLLRSSAELSHPLSYPHH